MQQVVIEIGDPAFFQLFAEDALLILLGAVGIVWGGVLAIRKLMGGQRNDDSWLKIAALIIVGGAFLTGSQAACKAACGAFTEAVLEVGRDNIRF